MEAAMGTDKEMFREIAMKYHRFASLALVPEIFWNFFLSSDESS